MRTRKGVFLISRSKSCTYRRIVVDDIELTDISKVLVQTFNVFVENLQS